MSIRALLMSQLDDVVTVLSAVKAEESVEMIDKKTGEVAGYLASRSGIDPYHKLARHDIACGDEVRKYGEVIGVAVADIRAGEHVHVNNIESAKTRNHD